MESLSLVSPRATLLSALSHDFRAHPTFHPDPPKFINHHPPPRTGGREPTYLPIATAKDHERRRLRQAQRQTPRPLVNTTASSGRSHPFLSSQPLRRESHRQDAALLPALLQHPDGVAVARHGAQPARVPHVPVPARHQRAHVLAAHLRAQGARGRLRRARRVGQRRQGRRPVPQGGLQRRRGRLLPGPDPQRRRAHDELLQVHDLRRPLARELVVYARPLLRGGGRGRHSPGLHGQTTNITAHAPWGRPLVAASATVLGRKNKKNKKTRARNTTTYVHMHIGGPVLRLRLCMAFGHQEALCRAVAHGLCTVSNFTGWLFANHAKLAQDTPGALSPRFRPLIQGICSLPSLPRRLSPLWSTRAAQFRGDARCRNTGAHGGLYLIGFKIPGYNRSEGGLPC